MKEAYLAWDISWNYLNLEHIWDKHLMANCRSYIKLASIHLSVKKKKKKELTNQKLFLKLQIIYVRLFSICIQFSLTIETDQ